MLDIDKEKAATKSTEFETLDPQDWEKARQLMYQMIDDAIDFTANLRDRKIWQEMPEAVLESFTTAIPKHPTNAANVYTEFSQNILPYPMGSAHPRFWAWYIGNGTVSGFMGDFWASVMNPNLGGGNHAAHKVEEQVVNWLKEILSFPKTASGLFVSGGSMANFTGLAIARNVKAGYDIRAEGLVTQKSKKMIVYASTEIHSSNQKAIELLGLGTSGLRKIPVQEDFTINVELLKNQIAKDRAAGLQPIAIIGTAGTINTGAIDDLNTLATICDQEDLWFHIDGAIGAVAILADSVKAQLAGIERADSLALDLHKWLQMPFEAGVVLVKNKKAHRNTFSLTPEYLAKNTRGVAAGDNWFLDYGLQLSRRFRALKVWMSFKEHGTKRFGRMIDRNVAQAKYLGKLIRANKDLELTAPISLDIVCFRYNPGHKTLGVLNALNKEIKLQLEEQNIALPGYTTINDIYCLHIAIASHRATYNDFDVLIENVLKIGEELSHEEILKTL